MGAKKRMTQPANYLTNSPTRTGRRTINSEYIDLISSDVFSSMLWNVMEMEGIKCFAVECRW